MFAHLYYLYVFLFKVIPKPINLIVKLAAPLNDAASDSLVTCGLELITSLTMVGYVKTFRLVIFAGSDSITTNIRDF